MAAAADEPGSGPAAGPARPSPAPARPARPGLGWADEDQVPSKDDLIWSADPADWPDDSWAWPGGQEDPPDEDQEPPGKPRAAETFAAGFTHRDAAGWGPAYATGSPSGFAAGGPADALAPGPVLAGLLAHAWTDGLAALTDDELVGVMAAARRVCSWQTALEFATVAELDARRRAQVGDAADPRAAAHTTEELAAALVLTGRAANILLDLADGLARLPAVFAALASGAIDRARAVIFVDELVGLAGADAVSVAASVLPRAGDLTTGQLRAALHRAVLAFDPAAARRRRERAAADARVETWTESSGNGALAGRELSPADVIAATRNLTAHAHALKAAGAPGTVDQLRLEAYKALLSGRSLETLVPTPTPGQPGPKAPRAGDGPSRSGLAWPTGPIGTIHLTTPLTAWLGLSDNPGSVAGFGPVDATTCRDLAAMLAGRDGTRWLVTVTGPDGQALGHASARTGPPGAGSPPRAGSGPPGTGPPGTGPPGTGPPGTGPPETCQPGTDLAGVARWLAGLTIQWLETSPCGHRRQTAAYRPTRLLHDLVVVRNPTCSFRGCRRPAQDCDLDHVLAYDQGGRTCECNLHPVCRRHHRTKQARGWHLDQPRPGVLVWTAPHGRRYTTTAEPYPT